MNKKQAIRDSIKHWQENKAIVLCHSMNAIPMGHNDCALCIWAGTKTKRALRCDVCPLCDFTAICCCHEYMECDNIADTFEDMEDFTQDVWEAACQAMIDKLESLLEK